MTIATAKEMLIEATRGKYAVGAFNITSLVQLEAVVDAAVETKSPVIIQTSVKPSQFFKPGVMVSIYRALAEAAPVPICLHLDHCTDVAYCKTCAAAGYTNIHLLPMYQQKMAYGSKGFPWTSDICHRDVSYRKGICPVAETLHESTYMGFAMCMYELKDDDIDLIVRAFRKVWGQLARLK